MVKRVLIGTSNDCDYRIDDKTVSRHHADLIIKGDGSCLIIDHQSTNGTFVRDQTAPSSSGWKKIKQAPLKKNAVIMLGAFELQIQDVLGSIQTPDLDKVDAKPKALKKALPKPEKFIRNAQGQIVPAN
ncbi:FHA domain-containing protein [Thiomicrospira microaerophila]|uniref:FHA domain-containing protein n=1 Tax=Thiomicrospira microaerophila TaxID=406020 RepID=UPI0005C8DAED|nr:FHA domain-containing protein [Thiomicrospira microaerophila]